jgi:hypothetical protein
MTIKLSELKAARAAMTIDGALYASDEGRVYHVKDGISRTIADVRAPLDDARGIVATHNAADVLIEIAETGLALSAAGKAFAECKWPKGSDFRRRLEMAAINAETVHLAALAKVTL